MYKEAIKITCLGLALALISCGGKKQDSSGAENLYNEANGLYEQGKYSESMILIDSLNKTYPTELDILKKGLHLRTLNTEKITINEIISVDSLYKAAESTVNELKSNFVFVKTKDMVEGYTINRKAANNPLINRTGISIRISENDSLYILSLVNGKNIGHNQISISGPTGSVSSNVVAYNGSTNYHFKDGTVNNEMVTFRGSKVDSLANYVTENLNSNLKLNFIGKSTFSIPLSQPEKEIISQTERYSSALLELKKADMQKRYLDNKLQIAKAQAEKTKIK